jgi:hypothetical protein
MPSEWVGVVGALGGAAIGGVVTVASLIVKGRQDETADKRRNEREDRLRSDERAWQVKQQNIEQRRELYADLLRAADRLDSGLDHLAWLLEDAHRADDASAWRQHLEDDESRLGRAVALVEVQSPDDKLVKFAQEVRWRAESGLTRALLDDPVTGVNEERAKLHQALMELHRGCRRDLGYDADAG